MGNSRVLFICQWHYHSARVTFHVKLTSFALSWEGALSLGDLCPQGLAQCLLPKCPQLPFPPTKPATLSREDLDIMSPMPGVIKTNDTAVLQGGRAGGGDECDWLVLNSAQFWITQLLMPWLPERKPWAAGHPPVPPGWGHQGLEHTFWIEAVDCEIGITGGS